MLLQILRCKIHGARVTEADLNYEGSIGICPELMNLSGLLPNEKVDIYNVNNGQRFATYVIVGKKGEISLNGAAARLAAIGDKVIICAYTWLAYQEACNYLPPIVLVDEQNRGQLKPYPSKQETKKKTE